jgi:hypothetical protein
VRPVKEKALDCARGAHFSQHRPTCLFRKRSNHGPGQSGSDLARFKCGLKIECGSCGNSRTMDGIEVAKAWGTKPFATIRQRMKCSRCGEKDAQLTVLSPPGPR